MRLRLGDELAAKIKLQVLYLSGVAKIWRKTWHAHAQAQQNAHSNRDTHTLLPAVAYFCALAKMQCENNMHGRNFYRMCDTVFSLYVCGQGMFVCVCVFVMCVHAHFVWVAALLHVNVNISQCCKRASCRCSIYGSYAGPAPPFSFPLSLFILAPSLVLCVSLSVFPCSFAQVRLSCWPQQQRWGNHLNCA